MNVLIENPSYEYLSLNISVAEVLVDFDGRFPHLYRLGVHNKDKPEIDTIPQDLLLVSFFRNAKSIRESLLCQTYIRFMRLYPPLVETYLGHFFFPSPYLLIAMQQSSRFL